MAVGTAGYTAMLSVQALERNGGVGSFAIARLAKLGCRVVASTGRPAEAGYLKSLGAAEIVERASLAEPGRSARGQSHPGQRLCQHPLRRLRGRLRPGSGHGLPGHGAVG